MYFLSEENTKCTVTVRDPLFNKDEQNILESQAIHWKSLRKFWI